MMNDENIFYFHLGKSIADWQRIENQINMIFENVATSSDYEAYYDTDSFKDKLLQITAIIEQRFASNVEAIQRWCYLKIATEKQYLSRNKLVHSVLIRDASAKSRPRTKNPNKEILYLMPFFYNQKSFAKAERTKLDCKKIEDFGKNFVKLLEKLLEFEVYEIMGYKRPAPIIIPVKVEI